MPYSRPEQIQECLCLSVSRRYTTVRHGVTAHLLCVRDVFGGALFVVPVTTAGQSVHTQTYMYAQPGARRSPPRGRTCSQPNCQRLARCFDTHFSVSPAILR